jgi:hypothetical protein
MFNIHDATTRKQIDFKSITCEQAKALIQKMIANQYASHNCNSNYDVYAYEVCINRLQDVNNDFELFSDTEKETALNLVTQLGTYSVDSILIYC